MLSFSKFTEWQKQARELSEVDQWLAHRGKSGRGGDVLKLSPDHCSPPKFTMAGQYIEGGKNYWESPESFNTAMKEVILERFIDLAAAAMAKLDRQAAQALVNAEEEVAAAQTAIAKAKPKLAVVA